MADLLGTPDISGVSQSDLAALQTPQASKNVPPADKEAILKAAQQQQGAPAAPVQAKPEELIQGAQAAHDISQGREQQAAQLSAAHPSPKAPSIDDLRIPPQQASAFMPLMLAMAALSGARTATPMQGAIQNMNGIMQAQITGNKDIVDTHEKQMWEQYNAAVAAHKEDMAELKPKIEALAVGSPESMENMRLELYKRGYSASVVDQLMQGNAYKNILETYKAQNQVMESLAKNETAMKIRSAENESKERVAAEKEGQPIDAKTVDFYASQSLSGDNSWQVGLARGKVGQKLIAAVKDRIPTMAAEKNMTSQDAAANKSIRTSLDKALADRTKYVAAGTQFVNNFNKQSELVEKYLSPGVGGATPVFNKWIQAGRKQVAGDPEVSALDTAIRGLAREHQRIVTGVTSNAQIHASAQETADQLLNISQTEGQIRANLKEMHEEAQNALQSGNDEVDLLKTQLKHIGVSSSSGTAPPAAIEYLKAHPEAKDQFKAKYGYLP